MDNGATEKTKKRKGYKLKSRILMTLPLAAAIPFMVIISGTIELYAGNIDQFVFSVSDFLPHVLLLAGIVFAVICAVLIPLRKKAFDVVYSVFASIGIMLFLQGNFLNFGMDSLAEDGVGAGGEGNMLIPIIINTLIWLAVAAVIIFFFARLKKNRKLVKTVSIIVFSSIIVINAIVLLVIALTTDAFTPPDEREESVAASDETDEETLESTDEGSSQTSDGQVTDSDTDPQGTTADQTTDPADTASPDQTTDDSTTEPTQTTEPPVSDTGTETEPSSDTEPPEIDPEELNLIVSTEGLTSLSKEGNVFVFVIDRFDISYYNALLKEDPEFFNTLDGFTFYDNHISLYARTWPAVPYMLTGVENDFKKPRLEFFSEVYKNSEVLSELKKNGYSVNIFTDGYYAYGEAYDLYGVADNVRSTDGYEIVNTSSLAEDMVKISLYRYLPTVLKGTVDDVGTADFNDYVKYHSDYVEYNTENQNIYSIIKGNIDISEELDGKKNFAFIHMAGCHMPCSFDENCNELDKTHNDGAVALRGSFKIINEYINRLKELDLYRDATIIITGDHARAISDTRDVSGPRITSLFVKKKGDAGTELKYSSAPVAQSELIATIFKSEGINTELELGYAFDEIPEDSDRKRKYYFQRNADGYDEIVVYSIEGNANDFDNWKLTERINIGKFYR